MVDLPGFVMRAVLLRRGWFAVSSADRGPRAATLPPPSRAHVYSTGGSGVKRKCPAGKRAQLSVSAVADGDAHGESVGQLHATTVMPAAAAQASQSAVQRSRRT